MYLRASEARPLRFVHTRMQSMGRPNTPPQTQRSFFSRSCVLFLLCFFHSIPTFPCNPYMRSKTWMPRRSKHNRMTWAVRAQRVLRDCTSSGVGAVLTGHAS